MLAAHLKGEVHIGLYPWLDADKCWWLAADFDGPEAITLGLYYSFTLVDGRFPAMSAPRLLVSPGLVVPGK